MGTRGRDPRRHAEVIHESERTRVTRLAYPDRGARLARLAGLKDRVEALGGFMLIDSPRGGGTSLRVEFPLTPSRRVVIAEGQGIASFR